MNSVARAGLVVLLVGCARDPPEEVAPAVEEAPARPPVSTEPMRMLDGFETALPKWISRRSELDPNWATRIGVHDYDDRVTRYDDPSWDARVQLARSEAGLAEGWGSRRLEVGADGRADRKLFETMLRAEAHEYQRHDARTDSPGLALSAISAVNDLLIRDFAPQSKRATLAVLRLQQVPDVIGDLRERLARPPRLWTEMAIRETDGALAFLDEVPALAGPTPGLADAIATARAALTGYRAFLQDELLLRSDGDFAVGRGEFDWRLRNVHLLDLDADGLLALGEEQFARTVQMLEQTAMGIDPTRDWKALLAEMMQQHPTAEVLLDTYRDEVARARAFLIERDIVGIPEEQLQIRETPAFMRTTVPFAAYDAPAPLDSSRLGTFFVTPDPEAHILADIPGTTWHEAYPGHHLQFVYAKDNPSLVRRLNDSPLLSEGWGFYCEELASETGYYDDPRERLMQLNWRLQRAARVILDVSVHAFGMSYDDAVTFLVERVGLAQGTAEASVNAYTQQATYFSSYMLGMLEIVRLREACGARLGPRFTLREFHERLLRCGNVPPALVEQALAAWR